MWFWTFVGTSLLGTAMHFLYDLWPTALTALFAPINESVWEHLKLLFWPMLLGAVILARKKPNKERYWSSFFIALLGTPALLLLCFYGLKALGIASLTLDISLYYICMFFGYTLARWLYRKKRPEKAGGFLLMVLILYVASLILFTFAAPDLPIFRDFSQVMHNIW